MEDIKPQNTATVAFQGERGAFSEDAARQLLGSKVETIPCRTFEEMFEAVSTGSADAAAAPIENSLAGSVHKNYDLLMEHELTIIGETNVRIVHHLIAPRGVALADVRRVRSARHRPDQDRISPHRRATVGVLVLSRPDRRSARLARRASARKPVGARGER